MANASTTTPDTPADPIRYLSGVQPSGRLHLGNYFGAIKGHIESQALPNTECYYFIANYHSLTTIQDRATLLDNTFDVAVTYLALGLDPERTVFYRQSDVPEVTELSWILSTCVGMGLLGKAHSYKDKAARRVTVNAGIYTYPLLMAADILGPAADVVPVGQDQKQHIEMTRDMATAFNAVYCRDREPVFKLPDAMFTETPKVPGTSFDTGNVIQLILRDKESQLATNHIGEVKGRLANVAQAAKTVQDISVGMFGLTTSRLPATSVSLRILPRTETPGTVREEMSYDGPLKVWAYEYVVSHQLLNTEDDGKRIPAKMSKSYGNTIEIFAEGKALKKAVMGIETDKKELHEPLDPDDDLVFALYKLFATADEQAEMRENYVRGGYGYGNAKKALLAKIDAYFEPYREKRKELLAKPEYVEEVLQEGARKARRVIRDTTDAARDACGLPRLAHS